MTPDAAYDSIGTEVPGLITHGAGCADCGGESYGGGVNGGCGGCGGDVIGGCGGCGGDVYGGYGGYSRGCVWPGPPWWANNLSLFAGAHGFKGPVDQGSNGNFGFHEGLNAGFPLLQLSGINFQAGMLAAYSNFSGNQVDGVRTGERDQIFFTSGVFRRATCGGLQGGVAYDLLYDRYYREANLSQVRAELSYIGQNGCREFGYMGSVGVGNDEVVIKDVAVTLEPTDLHAFFFRSHFDRGEARIWAGFSSEGDGLVGADARVMVGQNWALQSNFNYLIPSQDHGLAGLTQESWGMAMQIVWYPGRSLQRGQDSRARPLFNVADNSVFMVDAF